MKKKKNCEAGFNEFKASIISPLELRQYCFSRVNEKLEQNIFDRNGARAMIVYEFIHAFKYFSNRNRENEFSSLFLSTNVFFKEHDVLEVSMQSDESWRRVRIILRDFRGGNKSAWLVKEESGGGSWMAAGNQWGRRRSGASTFNYTRRDATTSREIHTSPLERNKQNNNFLYCHDYRNAKANSALNFPLPSKCSRDTYLCTLDQRVRMLAFDLDCTSTRV